MYVLCVHVYVMLWCVGELVVEQKQTCENYACKNMFSVVTYHNEPWLRFHHSIQCANGYTVEMILIKPPVERFGWPRISCDNAAISQPLSLV